MLAQSGIQISHAGRPLAERLREIDEAERSVREAIRRTNKAADLAPEQAAEWAAALARLRADLTELNRRRTDVLRQHDGRN